MQSEIRQRANIHTNNKIIETKNALFFKDQIKQAKKFGYRDFEKIPGGKFGVLSLINDDSGKDLIQQLFPKEYMFFYRVHPAVVFMKCDQIV